MRKKRDVVSKSSPCTLGLLFSSLRRDLQPLRALRSGRMRRTCGTVSPDTWTSGEHRRGCTLSWCYGLMKHHLFPPALLGISLIQLAIVFVRLTVLLSGALCVDSCVLQEPERVASLWQHRLKYIHSLVCHREGV